MQLSVRDEVSPLKHVVLGIADSVGSVPSIENAYDPKSIQNIRQDTYPIERDMIKEIDAFKKVLLKYDVQVSHPKNIENCNQIFVRDIAFVIEDIFIRSNILPNRELELNVLDSIIETLPQEKIICAPEDAHIEGGDVILWNEYIFIGTYSKADYSDLITARTNKKGVEFIKSLFPNRKVIDFELVKSNTNAYKNALHLDCCFQPVGNDNAIIHKKGFENQEDVMFLESLYGKRNILYVDSTEMYDMFCNIFSILPKVIVSEKSFTRLNDWLRLKGFIVEEIPYSQISKQEGLLRCSTLPLLRS